MVVVSYSGKEINAKLVYYGAGLSGKTTNLESIYEAVPDSSRGKMVSMKTQSDRTLFFDLLPLDLGEIMGFKTRFLLYTVPGQVFYNATRKLVLKGADAIVFVADSEVGKMEENKESIANLRANLAEYGVNLDQMSWVIQYNKRDLPNVYTIDELNAELNPGGKIPFFEAVAKDGKGVFETFRGISHLLMEKVTRDLRRTSMTTTPSSQKSAAAPVEEPIAPARAAAPMPPAHTIPREVRETPAPAMTETVRGVDYGREIELPDGAARMSAPAEAPKAAAPMPRLQTETINPPPQFEKTATVPVRTPMPTATPIPPKAAPVAHAPVAATPDADGTLVVPVKLPKGATHEIVLRIVLKVEE